MNFEPQKFFIGLSDFFSIILPGALLTWFVGDSLVCNILADEACKQLIQTNGLSAFLFGSYLLGHFAFLLGAFLDVFYDGIRAGTRLGQVRRLAGGKARSKPVARLLAGWWLKKDSDKALFESELIRDHYLAPLGNSHAVNAFQWCKARLALESPEAMAAVQRFEADSKFFRSLVVVLLAIMLWAVKSADHPANFITIGLPMMLLAFWRYVDQRAKSVDQACWFVITKEATNEKGYRLKLPSDQQLELTHAGGVVFRVRAADQQLEFLLVQASQDPEEWVLPKGHIEPGETPAQTAVREVQEETGVWARNRGVLDKASFATEVEHVRVQFFLMEGVAADMPEDSHRKSVWLVPSEAQTRVRHDESKALLNKAGAQIRSMQ